jgi:flagellar biosynthesis GTPase FlhF
MGVKGFWTRLLKDYSQSMHDFVEDIFVGSTLLVDGNSFIFHLIDRQMSTIYKHLSFPKEYGGNYHQLEQMIFLEIERLQLQYGFRLIFYFDGPISYYKGDTTEKRRQQLIERWNNLFNVSQGFNPSEPSSLPMPPLFSVTLRRVLDELRIKQVTCRYEADYEMAIDCAKFNRQNAQKGLKKTFCYSSDSDFLFFQNCPLIAIGTLDDAPTAAAVGSSSHGPVPTNVKQSSSKKKMKATSVVVWKRSDIASLYNIDEELLIKWAIIIGNDYTGSFPKTAFHSSLSSSSFSYDIIALLQEIKKITNEIDFDSLSNKDLRFACLYSWKSYNLEELKDLYLQEYITVNNMESSTECEEGILLLSSHKQRITHWLSYVDLSEETSLAQVTLRFCRDCLETSNKDEGRGTKNISKKQSSTSSALSPSTSSKQLMAAIGGKSRNKPFVESESILAEEKEEEKSQKIIKSIPQLQTTINDLSKIFSIEQMNIFQQMIEQLSDNNYKPSMKRFILIIKWENILAGNFFQLIAKEIHRLLTIKMKEQGKKCYLELNPCTLYDGTLFHVLARSLINKKKDEITQTISTASTTTTAKDKMKKSTSSSNGYNEELPIDKYRDEILHRINNDRVIVLCGETGCGKSTRVPLYLYEQSLEKNLKCKIIVCQPRRIAVVNLKNRLKEKLGDKVCKPSEFFSSVTYLSCLVVLVFWLYFFFLSSFSRCFCLWYLFYFLSLFSVFPFCGTPFLSRLVLEWDMEYVRNQKILKSSL